MIATYLSTLLYTVDMKSFKNMGGSVLVLKRGENLIEQLSLYAVENDLGAAWIYGLGGAASITISWYDLEKKVYKDKRFESVEILSLTGNLSVVDRAPFWHIHGSFSGSDYKTVGGHVQSLTVGPTCEIYLTPLDTPMSRQPDSTTGLKLLCDFS